MKLPLTIIFERASHAGTNMWIATIPEVPGAFSEGLTKDEARENVLDALSELTAARRELALSSRKLPSEIETLTLSS